MFSFSLHDDSISIQIRDEGRAFDPLMVPEPNVNQPVEQRKIGGLGIHLVKKLMDSVSYERKNNENIVTLRKSFI